MRDPKRDRSNEPPRSSEEHLGERTATEVQPGRGPGGEYIPPLGSDPDADEAAVKAAAAKVARAEHRAAVAHEAATAKAAADKAASKAAKEAAAVKATADKAAADKAAADRAAADKAPPAQGWRPPWSREGGG